MPTPLSKIIADRDAFARMKSEDVYRITLGFIQKHYHHALRRVQHLEQHLRDLFVGENMADNIRMLIACAVAQEPVLFVGGPGLAKTELAIAFYESTGLRKPTRDDGADAEDDVRAANKYYEYLLSAFTLPEELFGPYDVQLLAEGRFKRRNDNMLTGNGVRGCFLDEVFRGSSNILNTMLTLINERRYFDDGVFHQSDLAVIIGASNTTPTVATTSFSGSVQLPSKTGNELLAFYDRFTIRLHFRYPEAEKMGENVKTSDYYKIREKSVAREQYKLVRGQPFNFQKDAEDKKLEMPSINDLLLLSRILFPSTQEHGVIARPSEGWIERFLKLGMHLANLETSLVRISPRKMTRLEKLSYALALLDHPAGEPDRPITVGDAHLAVFKHIWENEQFDDQLTRDVDQALERFGH